jgi:predicted Zn-dependent protease with MMP-like domain
MRNGKLRTVDWATAEAPSLEVFDRLARTAFQSLPETFRQMCADIVIRVSDFPEDDVLEDLGAETPFDLLGLFQGIGLAQRGEPGSGTMPNMIFLYRRPILDYWAENEETLGTIITHVLVHEIGHHFGLSDDDMERIEALVDT